MDDFLSEDLSEGFDDRLEVGLADSGSADLACAREDGLGEVLSEFLSDDLSDGFEDGRDEGRSEFLVEGREEVLSEEPVAGRSLNCDAGLSDDLDDGLSIDLDEGFEDDLNLGFSSPSWKFLPAGLPPLLYLEAGFGFLMNLEKSPCLLDFPPDARGFSESFISILNWVQR